MVGVPLSHGCLECIRLHVKCDEGKPYCFRCQMGKKQCPGYNRPLKFVNVDPETQKADHQSTGRTAVEAASRSKSNTPKGSRRSSPTKRLANRSRAASDDTTPTPGYSSIASNFGSEHLFELFVDHALPYDDKAHELQFMRKWLLTLPQAPCQGEVLQDAIRCLSAHYLALKSKTDEAVHRSSECYDVALRSLQAAILDPSASRTHEMISATMLLSLYEVFVCTNINSWVHHAGGVGRLMQLQQADAWDKCASSMFIRGCRFQLVMEAFMTKTPCFLAQAPWKERAWAALRKKQATPLQRLADEYWELVAELPGLAAESRFYQADHLELIHRAVSLEAEIDAWFDCLQRTTGIPASSTRFESNYIASMYSSYYAAKCVLITLTTCDSSSVAGRRQDAATYTEMTCEIVSGVEINGVLEPYYFIFPLLMAQTVVPSPELSQRIEQLQDEMRSMMDACTVPRSW